MIALVLLLSWLLLVSVVLCMGAIRAGDRARAEASYWRAVARDALAACAASQLARVDEAVRGACEVTMEPQEFEAMLRERRRVLN